MFSPTIRQQSRLLQVVTGAIFLPAPECVHMAKVFTQDEALRRASNIARAPNLNAFIRAMFEKFSGHDLLTDN